MRQPVTLACPQCAAPAAFAADGLDAAGGLVRCARCGTAWLARVRAADQFGRSGHGCRLTVRKPVRPRFERVIEHVDPSFSRKAPQQAVPARGVWTGLRGFRLGRAATGRRPGLGAAGVLAALVAVLALSSGVVGAPPDATAQYAGIEIRLLRGAIEPVRNGHALAVEGEITNRTDGEVGVPAVRVSLRAQGAEVYSWFVEPTTARLAAGGAVQFRSVLAAPPRRIDEVAFRLAERPDAVIGMR